MVARWGRARVEVARDLSSWELVVPQASGPPQRIQCPPWDIAETKRALEREEILYLCTTYERDNDYHSPLRNCSYYLFRNEVWSASPFHEKWTSEQSEGKDPLLVDHIRDKAKALPGSYGGLHWRERDPFPANPYDVDPLRVGVMRRRRARIEVARDLSSWKLVVPRSDGPPQRIQCQPRDIAETKRAQEREEILYLCTTYKRDDDYNSMFQSCSYYLFHNGVWSASPFDEKWTRGQSEGRDPLLVDYIRDRAAGLEGDGLHWRDREPFLVEEAEGAYGPASHRVHLITINSNVSPRVTPAAWQQAEYLCASALRQFGFDDARVTESGPDGGVDILGSTIAAQVKYTNRPVGRPLVQQLIGAAGGRVTAFFSLAGFSAQAIECAGEASMALFVVRLPCTVIPLNDAARSMSEDTLG